MMLLNNREELVMMGGEPEKKETPCNRCGDCCKAFTLGMSPAQMKANFDAVSRGDEKYWYVTSDGRVQSKEVNGMLALWYPALTPISPAEALRNLGNENPKLAASAQGQHWYSCRNLESTTKEDGTMLYACGIFERRPSVCALFKPVQDGGYLTRVGMIDAYVNCSYRPVLEEKEQENNVALPVTQGIVPIGYVGDKPYFPKHTR